MTKKRKWTPEQFIEAVKSSYSIRETLKKMGLCASGSNYYQFYKYAKELNVDIGHFLGQSCNREKKCTWKNSIPLPEILIQNSSFLNTSHLKKRLFSANLLENKCYLCGIGPDWNGKSLSLQLDHINGIRNDNRIENLRILCPNCHSQTRTFAGRRFKKEKKKEYHFAKNQYKNLKELFTPKQIKTSLCIDCGTKVKYNSKRCVTCYHKYSQSLAWNRNTKIKWPSDSELVAMVTQSNYYALAKKLGVSDNAIRKRLKRRGLYPAQN